MGSMTDTAFQNTQPSAPLPAWTRFPRNGQREPISGLSRATLYRLREAGLITVKNLRRPGCIRGAALISVVSLLKAIEAGDSGQKGSDV